MDGVEVKQAFALALDFTDYFVVQIVNGAVASSHGHAAFLAVEVYAKACAFEPARGAALAFPGDPLVTEVESGDNGIRGFPVVFVEIAVAAAGHPLGEFHAQSPTREVERVDAVVAKFAGAPIPEPMPVVMDDIILEWPFGRGPLPQGIIEPLRHGGRFAVADRGAVIGVPPTGKAHPAKLASVQGVDGLNHPRPTAALVAHLHDALVFARSGHHEFALAQVVAARFLDIDMLAGGAGKDGGGRVRVREW